MFPQLNLWAKPERQDEDWTYSMRKLCLPAVLATGIILSSCSGDSDTSSTSMNAGKTTPSSTLDLTTVNDYRLSTHFDCLRENGGVAIAAHRGGPYPGYPENAINTFEYGRDHDIRVFEIDVAESQDGVLFLMHDTTLTRTTTGHGFVAEKDWAYIRDLKLIDNEGTTTDLHPPTLRDALEWAIETNSILELDKKPTTSFRNIIGAVREVGAENNVILISYDNKQAEEIAGLAPDLMMTASAFSARDVDELKKLGVRQENLIAWTGISGPDFKAWHAVRDIGIEPAFGTLGRPGERLDDQYLADNDGSEFQDLQDQGLVLIATDAPLEVARFITGDDIAKEKCAL